MADIVLEIDGMGDLSSKMRGLSKAAQGQIAEDAVTEGASVVQFWAQNNAKMTFSNNQRGQLRNSIYPTVQKTTEGVTAEVGPHVIYGRIQELGGTVRPIRAKMLHFVIDHQDIFAKQVTITPHPYLRPAVEDHEEQIRSVVAASIADGIEEFKA